MSTPSPTDMPDRRRFLKLIGFAAASTTMVGPAGALAQTTKSRRPGAQPRRGAESEGPEISPEARDLTKIVKRRYGDHLTNDQLESVTTEIEYRLRSGKQLRDLKLANHDEPDFIFRA